MSDLPKLFVIGFSKTATTTIHKFFSSNGYKSIHWDLPDGRFLAGVVATNVLSDRPILATIDDYTVYSEFSYADGNVYLEANYFFRELYAAYPDAYFLLNVRDTDGWIKSRQKHFGRNKKGRGSLADRISKAYAATPDETETIWRSYHKLFHEQVKDFFQDKNDARFLEFDIHLHGPRHLIEWLRPHFQLNQDKWRAENITIEQQAIRKLSRSPLRRLMRKLGLSRK